MKRFIGITLVVIAVTALNASALTWANANDETYTACTVIAAYHLDETSGTVADNAEGTAAKDLNASNTAVFGASGDGWGGSGKHIDTAGLYSLYTATGGASGARPLVIDTHDQGITLSYWMKSGDTSGDSYPVMIHRKPNDYSMSHYFGFSASDARNYVKIAAVDQTTASDWADVLEDDAWHHVGLVYDPDRTGAEGALYIDNVEKETWSMTGSAGWDTDEGTLTIASGFDGELDEILVLKGVWTDFSDGYRIPEPATMALLGVGGSLVMLRRRRRA